MERFCRFGRIFLLVTLIGSSVGKTIYFSLDSSLAALNSVPAALMSIFSFGAFVTLIAGFILCIVWVFIHLFGSIVRLFAHHPAPDGMRRDV
ncbi:MAG: hypothetical protein LBO04_01525 [Spirochaetaceae bacterium]|jgi:hypothetical protein|nr:hypothetical protein [Spirochaetaceae bacterium]